MPCLLAVSQISTNRSRPHPIRFQVVLCILPFFSKATPRLAQPIGLEPLTLRGPASAAGISPHGNGLLLLQHIVEESKSALKLPSVNRLRCLAGVLERGAEVAAASPGGLCVVDAGCSVADLRYQLAAVAIRER